MLNNFPDNATSQRRSKLLFVVTEDWYFWSHRLPIARAARDKGLEVMVATRVNSHAAQIIEEGFTLLPLKMMRESWNPWHEFRTVMHLIRIYRRESPDLIHLVALKPIVYGSIARLLTPSRAGIVGAIAGMGYLGTSTSLKAKVLRPIVALALRFLFMSDRTRILVQNPEDAELIRARILRDPERVALIKGAGVDTTLFKPTEEPSGIPTVVLACRMLSNKGVFEFVEAARLLRKRGTAARFVMVGDTDLASPAAISRTELEAWQGSGVVEWLGHSYDMPAVLQKANIVCLPSYREGLPKVLVEAMSAERPIVATNVPGCREVVRHGDNGLLVPVRDAESLANALDLLISNPQLRKEMGKKGREIALREFSLELIGEQTMQLYAELLGKPNIVSELVGQRC